MVKKSEEWDGVTGGTTLGQKAMKVVLSIFDVRIGYAIMGLVVPFYMLFHHKGYVATVIRPRNPSSKLTAITSSSGRP